MSTREETALANYGDELSGWWLLWRKLNPFLTMPKIPVMEDIASRLAFISANNFLNQMQKKQEDVEVLQPPVTHYGVLEWDKIKDIVKLGEDSARHQLQHCAQRLKVTKRLRAHSMSTPHRMRSVADMERFKFELNPNKQPTLDTAF